jgi:excinuclease ABC subunit B
MFKLVSKYKPKGDQEKSIKTLSDNIKKGVKKQVLLGATGTGKTFTIANVIANTNKCAIIMVHNKTLAGQLYSEFKELFPNNHVEYFISYFDFFQPEAYIPKSDTYIEKNSKSNQEIEMLRLSSINSLAGFDDVIVVASVAAIYASVSPNDFSEFRIIIKKGGTFNLKQLCYDLVRLQYKRNDVEAALGTFRLRGDTLEITPGYSDKFKVRISFMGNEVEQIAIVNPLTGKLDRYTDAYVIVPANEYIMNKTRMEEALSRIDKELTQRVVEFKSKNKLLEAQRIEQRTLHDMESIKELGYCNGIENYSRHLELREAGATPFTIFDFLKEKN